MKILKVLLVAAGVGYGSLTIAQDELEVLLTQYEWPDSASADAVLQIPQIRTAVARLMGTEDAQMIIRYPGGDAGNQWAIDLRNILVSLGIESSLMVLQPGSGYEETLVVIVTPNRNL